MNFIEEEVKKYPNILDNIGVIRIELEGKSERFGVLVTREKGVIYISFI